MKRIDRVLHNWVCVSIVKCIRNIFSEPKEEGEVLVDETLLQDKYDHIMEFCQKEGMNSDVMLQTTTFQKGGWRSYKHVLERIPLDLEGKVFADLGCKYGLLFPLLFQYKIKKAIGIEGLEELIQVARQIYSVANENEPVEFVLCKDGYLPLQPETVDVVLANEVISHVNPIFLSTLFLEIGRILKTGGVLFISDGNNLSCPGYFEDRLLPLYDALENGPDGARVEELTIQRCIMNQRKDIIIRRHPGIPEEQVDFLARNTFGLWGDRLDEVADQFILTGELIRRPCRRGIAPTYPTRTWAGEVEEKGFYPERVMLELMEYGFDARILDVPARSSSAGRKVVLSNDGMTPVTGFPGKHAYTCPIPDTFPGKDCPALVLENDQPLLVPNAMHAEIADRGMGRYSIWRGYIMLSTSDNTDPRENGRRYELYWTKQVEDRLIFGTPNFQICAVRKKDPA